MEKLKKDEKSKLHLGTFFAWKSSDISSAWVSWIVNTYMLFYCTDSLGMNSAVAGTLLLAANIFDAVTDVIVGYVIDSSKVTKWGKVRPYELAILGVTICTLLMFMCPDGSADWLKYVWVFFFYCLTFGVFNTLRFGAQTPYMIRAFHNDRQLIGKVSAYGGLVTTMGAAACTMLFPKLMGVFAYSTDITATGSVYHLNAEGWTKLMAIFMIPATLIAIFRFIFVKEDNSIDTGKEAIPFSFKEIIKMIKANRYIWGYFFLILAFNLVQNLGASAYYFQWVYGDTGATGTISIMAYFMLPLMLFIPPLLKKFGATKIIWFTAIIAIAGYVVNFFAGQSMILLIIGSILTALVTLPISYLGGVILMQICNYNEYKGIARQEGTTTSICSSIGSQLGQGIGPFITGLVLEWTHYDGTLAVQPDSAIMGIRLLYSLIPAVCIIIIFFASHFLSKLEKFSPEMERIIAERKMASLQEK